MPLSSPTVILRAEQVKEVWIGYLLGVTRSARAGNIDRSRAGCKFARRSVLAEAKLCKLGCKKALRTGERTNKLAPGLNARIMDQQQQEQHVQS